jgi:hypothetical protein
VFALFASIALASAGVACSSSEGGGDLTDAAAAVDGATSSSDSGGGGTDSSTPVDSSTGIDATPATDGGGAIAYLQECQTVGTPGDCAAGLTCKLFKGKGKNFCTKSCTGPADCPAPSKGCGGDNFCSPP